MNRLSDAGSIPAWSIGKTLAFARVFLCTASSGSGPGDRIKIIQETIPVHLPVMLSDHFGNEVA